MESVRGAPAIRARKGNRKAMGERQDHRDCESSVRETPRGLHCWRLGKRSNLKSLSLRVLGGFLRCCGTKGTRLGCAALAQYTKDMRGGVGHEGWCDHEGSSLAVIRVSCIQRR